MSDQSEQQAAKLTDEQVRHVAHLSRLKLTDEQVRFYAGQLSDVLGYMTKLGELDVQDVQPMVHPTEIVNKFREDEPQPGLTVDDALANAPASDPPFFKVPKVLGEGSGA